MQRTPEEILAKIKELSESESFSKERYIDYGNDIELVSIYDEDKTKDTLLALTEWLTGQKVQFPDPVPEPAPPTYVALDTEQLYIPAFGDHTVGRVMGCIGPLDPSSEFIWKNSLNPDICSAK